MTRANGRCRDTLLAVVEVNAFEALVSYTDNTIEATIASDAGVSSSVAHGTSGVVVAPVSRDVDREERMGSAVHRASDWIADTGVAEVEIVAVETLVSDPKYWLVAAVADNPEVLNLGDRGTTLGRRGGRDVRRTVPGDELWYS